MADEQQTPEKAIHKKIATLETESSGALTGIVNKISSFFWNGIKTEILYILTGLEQMAETFLKDLFVDPFKLFMAVFTTTDPAKKPKKVEDILNESSDPAVVLKSFEAESAKSEGLAVIFAISQYLTSLYEITSANGSAVSAIATQEVSAKYRQSLPGLSLVMEELFRDPSYGVRCKEILERYGFKDDDMPLMTDAFRSVLSPDIAKEAFLRGKIDGDKFKKVLQESKLNDEDSQVIEDLLYRLPPVQDIITMAVREVFSPDIASKFGQFQDYPAAVSKYGKQAGLDEFWLKNYWAAHWELPSISQGYEMLHRGVISPDELQVLLRALDVMPFWRDKLTQISYNPLTRVDVRRMYGMGILDEDGINKAYHAIGYSDENAALMTQFTVGYASGSQRELSKSDVLNLYEERGLSEDETLTSLQSLGYSKSDAALLIYNSDFKAYKKYKNEMIGYAKVAYIAGKINQDEVLSRLGKIDMPAEQANYLLNLWDNERNNKIAKLTLGNVKDLYLSRIISDDELLEELHELGYNKKDSDRFHELFLGKMNKTRG